MQVCILVAKEGEVIKFLGAMDTMIKTLKLMQNGE
jgi:hypothetical protein